MKVHKVRILLGVALALLLTTVSAFAAPLRQTPAVEFKEITGDPLRIQVGSNGSAQVFHKNHPNVGAAYGTADSGLFFKVDNAVYGPVLKNNGSTAYPDAPPTNGLNLVSHEGPTGSGSAADPFKIVTTQSLTGTPTGSDPNLSVVQTVSYINGNEYFRQDWDITNNGASEVCFDAYHAVDAVFAGDDNGLGYYNPARGSVGSANEARDWFMVFTPVTPADHYQEGAFNTADSNFPEDTGIWNAVSKGLDLTDSIVADRKIDNGFALQWKKCVQPGETTTISDLWSFGENEETVVPPPQPTATITPTPEPATATPTSTPTPEAATATPTSTPMPAIDTSRCLNTVNSHGDVHIESPDGLKYDFQATGDFLLTHSTTGDVVFQARQETPPQNPKVSVNTAAALWVAGDKLEIYTKPTLSFYVNDVLTELPSSSSKTLRLPQGGAITECVNRDNEVRKYTVLWPDGNTGANLVIVHRTNLNTTVLNLGVQRLNGSLTYEGLLGNLDRNAGNDMQVRNAAMITPPASAEQLASFGDSWRVSAGDTPLLDPLTTSAAPLPGHGQIQRVSMNQSLSFSPPLQDDEPADSEAWPTFADIDPEAREAARQICVSADIEDEFALNDCIYDVAMTNDETYVTSAMTYEEHVEELPPDVAEARVAAVPSQLPEVVEPVVQVDPATEEPTTEPVPAEDQPASGISGICSAPLAIPLLVGTAFMAVGRRRRR